MSGNKRFGLNWLMIVGFFWLIISPIWFGLSLLFIAFYDSPINPQGGMGFLDHVLIWSILSFPIFCVVSALSIWFLNKRNKSAATFAALLPIIPLIPIFVIFSWANSEATKEQGNVTQISECTSAVFDGGDGLNTTGCGALQIGVIGSGVLPTTAEAHNWGFTTEAGQVRITVRNDGHSCPHVIVLDSQGAIADSFEYENSLRLCTSDGDTITTGFFEFSPPGAGSYTIRLFSPEMTGAYQMHIK